MKTIPSILFILLCCLHTAYSQLVIDSTRFITGNQCCTEIYYSIPTADKGILFVGSDAGNPGGIIPYFSIDISVNGNVMIGKIDSNHQISWIKIYGGSQADGASSIVQTADGGYAVLASTASNDGDVTGFLGVTDIWLLRIDASGNLLWEKCYGSPAQDYGISIANTPDNGFIILGGSYGSGDDIPFHYGDMSTTDWIVIKTDSTGNMQWCKDLGGTGEEGDGSIITMDSSYYLVANSSSTDHDCTDTAWHRGVNTGADYYVLKLDNIGRVLWDSSYGGSGGDGVNYAMFDLRDSTIAITGTTNSDDYMVTGYQGGGDMWVVKVNKNGTLVWGKTLGSPNEEHGTGICADNNGGYMVYGDTRNDTTGQENLWLFDIDSTGNENYNKLFGGPVLTGNISYSIVPYLNGYVATGLSSADTFTEGSTYGNFDGGGPTISYINFGVLGVKNVSISTRYSINVFPNPAHESVNIFISNKETGNLIVMNCIGQVVYEQQISEKKQYIEINTEYWNNGIYLIKWQSVDGNVATIKLIKN